MPSLEERLAAAKLQQRLAAAKQAKQAMPRAQGLSGDAGAFVDPTARERIKSGAINLVGGAAEGIAQTGNIASAGLPTLIADPLQALKHPLDALIPRGASDLMRGRNRMGEIEGVATKAIDATKKAAGIRPNAILDTQDAALRFLGDVLVPIPGAKGVGKLDDAARKLGDMASFYERAIKGADETTKVRLIAERDELLKGTAPQAPSAPVDVAGQPVGTSAAVNSVADLNNAPESRLAPDQGVYAEQKLLQPEGASIAPGAKPAPTQPPLPDTKVRKLGTAGQLYRNALEPMSRALEKSGPVGAEVSKKLMLTAREAEQRTGAALIDLDRMAQLPKADQHLIVDILEARVDPATLPLDKAGVVQIAEKHRALLSQIGDEAEAAPLEILRDGVPWTFEKRANYFPHMFASEPQESLAFKTKGGEVAGGARYSRDFKKPGKPGRGTVDPVDTLGRYYSHIYRQLAEHKYFGLDGSDSAFNNTALEFSSRAAANGEDARYISDAFKTALGEHYRVPGSEERVIEGIRRFQAGAKLTTAGIPNLGQIRNVLQEFGMKNTAQAVRDVASEFGKFGPAKNIGQRSGAVFEGMLYNFMNNNQSVWTGRIATKILNQTPQGLANDIRRGGVSGALLKYTGFKATERWNRLVAANAAVHHAEDLMKLARGEKGGLLGLQPNPINVERAKASLRSMGVSDDAIARGVMGDQDKYNAAWYGSHKTQFGSRPEDLPLGWERSPWTKVITQFQSFGLKQAFFDVDSVVKPALNGNFKPLITLLGFSQIGGYAIDKFRDVLMNRDDEKELPAQMIENLYEVGTMGLLSSVMQGYEFKGRDENALGVGLRMLGGPTVSDLNKISTIKETEDVDKVAQRMIQPYRIIRGATDRVSE